MYVKKLATLTSFEGTCFFLTIPSNVQMFPNIDMHVDFLLVLEINCSQINLAFKIECILKIVIYYTKT